MIYVRTEDGVVTGYEADRWGFEPRGPEFEDRLLIVKDDEVIAVVIDWMAVSKVAIP